MSKRTNLKARLAKTSILLVMVCASLAGEVIYVDDSATGANDGSSWQNAYTFLQDALADAETAEKPVEIHVAQGIYKPDQGVIQTLGDQTATFQLINGVTLKGGYAGAAAPNINDIELYETVLSGDLSGNDIDVNDPGNLFDLPDRYDNSEIVVTGSNTDATAVLNGFTITDGYISVIAYRLGGGPSGGAGMLISSGSPTLIDCTFTDNLTANSGGGLLIYGDSNPTLLNCNFTRNYAESGGGIFSSESSPTLINCTFDNDYAHYKGGAMFNFRSNPELTNCTFRRNSTYGSSNQGGGMYNRNGNPVLTNCTFSENSAATGGGMLNEDCNTVLNMCEFVMNIASHYGGAMLNDGGQPIAKGCVFVKNYQGAVHDYSKIGSIFTNCIFIGNSSRGRAGALNVNKATVSHCLFAGNRAFGSGSTGGAAFNFNTAAFNNCTFSHNWAEFGNAIYCFGIAEINNCIFSGSEDQIHIDDPCAAPTFVRYSNVQGGWSGEGNIDDDPYFVDPGYWADADDPNIPDEPNDPNAVWIDGDYHLKSQAGRWDPVSQSWVVDDVTSPCIDAGDPNSPIGYEPFPNGGIINMGAYGGTVEASKSYFGKPVCETIIAGDINGDCKVDFDDLIILMSHWLENHNPNY
jgi:parallel beta-helix repeat protein